MRNVSNCLIQKLLSKQTNLYTIFTKYSECSKELSNIARIFGNSLCITDIKRIVI